MSYVEKWQRLAIASSGDHLTLAVSHVIIHLHKGGAYAGVLVRQRLQLGLVVQPFRGQAAPVQPFPSVYLRVPI